MIFEERKHHFRTPLKPKLGKNWNCFTPVAISPNFIHFCHKLTSGMLPKFSCNFAGEKFSCEYLLDVTCLLFHFYFLALSYYYYYFVAVSYSLLVFKPSSSTEQIYLHWKLKITKKRRLEIAVSKSFTILTIDGFSVTSKMTFCLQYVILNKRLLCLFF